MPRLATLVAIVLAFTVPTARAEDDAVYSNPPVYTDAMRLADTVHVAEVVVAGRIEAGDEAKATRLVVDDVVFGEVIESLRHDDGALRLAAPVRAKPDAAGVFLLARMRDGYTILEPYAIERTDYERAAGGLAHWSEQPGITATVGETQVYHTYHDEILGRPIWHGANTYPGGAGTIVELWTHGERNFVLWRDAAGHLVRIDRIPPHGHGFTIEYKNGRMTSFRHFRDGRDHGVARKFFPGRPDQMRSERHYDNGVLHGRLRVWGIDGALARDVVIEHGLEPRVVRYEGEPGRVAQIVRRGDRVDYAAIDRAAILSIEVGMTAEEVSEILMVDFSLKTGVNFPSWTTDSYLHIAFEDGRVSRVNQGHNGVCVAPRPR